MRRRHWLDQHAIHQFHKYGLSNEKEEWKVHDWQAHTRGAFGEVAMRATVLRRTSSDNRYTLCCNIAIHDHNPSLVRTQQHELK
jgi:hypothetical protein